MASHISPKTTALRENGAAGRKLSFALGDRVRANGQAPSDYRHRVGFITEIGRSDAEYRVEFDDGLQPTTGYLVARWLE